MVTSRPRADRGKRQGRAYIAIRFTELSPKGSGERYRIQTAAIGRQAPATKAADAAKIAAPAAGGAIVGGLIGGKKGALVGTAVGGGGRHRGGSFHARQGSGHFSWLRAWRSTRLAGYGEGSRVTMDVQ